MEWQVVVLECQTKYALFYSATILLPSVNSKPSSGNFWSLIRSPAEGASVEQLAGGFKNRVLLVLTSMPQKSTLHHLAQVASFVLSVI